MNNENSLRWSYRDSCSRGEEVAGHMLSYLSNHGVLISNSNTGFSRTGLFHYRSTTIKVTRHVGDHAVYLEIYADSKQDCEGKLEELIKFAEREISKENRLECKIPREGGYEVPPYYK